MQLRPWNPIPIRGSEEPLEALPEGLLRIEPHPYRSLGAPYGADACPFRLRRGVIERLLTAQALLQRQQPQWCLAIFDAWRPLAVQRFMVDHAIVSTCQERGIDPALDSPERQQAVADVGRFWAPPNRDPAAPPPHSTGAAVDLTLAECFPASPTTALTTDPSVASRAVSSTPRLLAMGSEIDAIGAVSEPDHFLAVASRCRDSRQRDEALEWHRRRTLLRQVMEEAGFAQHPNEWWHFSWGDQLWAWRCGAPEAPYGRVDAPEP
ncbi:MAG: M15 family metallopeptidase [Cyanobium sp.]|jgi:D-alanyl-D-alanine dipeptidase|nr:M15 family metallopeptidase [Cyanobium sp.]